MSPDEVAELSRNSQRVPNQRRPSQLVVEGVRAVNDRPELDNGRSQDISAYLCAHMQQNFQVSGTKALLNDQEFGQFNQPNPQDIVRHILLENFINVMLNSFGVQIFVYGLLGR